jgi:prepilin peptidase CpaA
MVAIVILLGLLLVATFTDVARYKIYNWTTYPGILAGFAVNLLPWDWPGLKDSLVGFCVCGTIMLVCFVLFNLGGGDVKLIAMMGAFLGLQQGIEAMLWTFVLGGVLGTAFLIWQIGLVRIISKNVQHILLVLRAKSWVPLTEEEREPLRRRLFLAPSGFAAVCIVAKDLLM